MANISLKFERIFIKTIGGGLGPALNTRNALYVIYGLLIYLFIYY